MKIEYGRCIVCGRRVKNRVYHKGLLIYICPRHLKGKDEKEISEYLDNLLKYGGKSSKEAYEDILKSISILDTKMSTLMDKIDVWMKIIGQKRLDDYKLSKNIERVMNMVSDVKEIIEKGEYIGKEEAKDELTFLNNLIKEYPEVSYRIEDGLATIRLKKNIDHNRFNKLSKMLRDRGYVYDEKLYKWVKSLF